MRKICIVAVISIIFAGAHPSSARESSPKVGQAVTDAYGQLLSSDPLKAQATLLTTPIADGGSGMQAVGKSFAISLGGTWRPVPGDLDGDGKEDLFDFDYSSEGTVTFKAIRGTDASILWTRTQAWGGYLSYFNLTGDARPEFVFVDVEESFDSNSTPFRSTETRTIQQTIQVLAPADGSVIWSKQIDATITYDTIYLVGANIRTVRYENFLWTVLPIEGDLFLSTVGLQQRVRDLVVDYQVENRYWADGEILSVADPAFIGSLHVDSEFDFPRLGALPDVSGDGVADFFSLSPYEGAGLLATHASSDAAARWQVWLSGSYIFVIPAPLVSARPADLLVYAFDGSFEHTNSRVEAYSGVDGSLLWSAQDRQSRVPDIDGDGGNDFLEADYGAAPAISFRALSGADLHMLWGPVEYQANFGPDWTVYSYLDAYSRPDVNADGIGDILVYSAGSAPDGSPSKQVLALFDGATGELIWETTSNNGSIARPAGGDFNGNGTSDFERQVSIAGPAGSNETTFRFRLFEGSDLTPLWNTPSKTVTGEYIYAYLFGADIIGDAKYEAVVDYITSDGSWDWSTQRLAYDRSGLLWSIAL